MESVTILAGGIALGIGLLLWRLTRRRRAGGGDPAERHRIEDALKKLFGEDGPGALGRNELGRDLRLDPADTDELVRHLARRGLARDEGERLALTESGRKAALRVLRRHRLYERYLSDRTGMPPTAWHEEAERAEHELSDADAERLASRLGHPRFDPHGDPIPTPDLDLPPSRGPSLAELSPGDRAEVTHVEDEPPEIFARIASLGIAPGARLRVAGRDGNRVTATIDGRKRSLDLSTARNVSVDVLPDDAEAGAAVRTLADARLGEPVTVKRLAPRCQGIHRRRLLDLGIVPGTRIVPELVAASGDPVAYRIRGALIGLRREQAEWIEIEPETDDG